MRSPQKMVNEEWSILCLDNSNDEFEPPAEELESMYQQLENGSMIELQWKSPGRRLPSPLAKSTNENDQDMSDTPEKESPSKNKEFDFMDEVATPTMRVRSTNSTLKGSAKKKTANFAGVIDAMKKQRQLVQPNNNSNSNSSSSNSSAGTASNTTTLTTPTTTTTLINSSSTSKDNTPSQL